LLPCGAGSFQVTNSAIRTKKKAPVATTARTRDYARE
jgi:hypothetical protein